jgi:hypothetical protein
MDEIHTKQGVDFFLAKTEAFVAQCKVCNGACEIRERDTVREEGFRRTGNPQGELYRLVPCPNCWTYVRRMKDFSQTFFQAVPPRYQGCIWSQLQPSLKSIVALERQAELMHQFRSDPDMSVAMFGPPGTSKTTWLTAMYAQAIWRSTAFKLGMHPAHRYTVKAMLDGFTQWQLHGSDPESDAMPPRVSRERIEKITKQGGKVHVFLEEIDKVKPTDARIANLFEVVDALYENMGQLVFNSNLTPSEFAGQFGNEFARRIAEMCTVVNLF